MPDKSSKRKEYKTVQLPKESTIMLDRIIEASPEFAYRSHAALVMDLIRRRYECFQSIYNFQEIPVMDLIRRRYEEIISSKKDNPSSFKKPTNNFYYK